MKDLNLHVLVKTLLYWYIFIFISTETLSHIQLLDRKYILFGESFFWVILVFFLRKEILKTLYGINLRSKSLLFIMTLFLLTFIQGFFSAPSTTDSMVYHLPRVMYWVQEKTLYQDVIRNSHDYMAPFGEYILLHLYFLLGSDRLLFFSQWVAYVVSVYTIGVIASQLGADRKVSQLVRLFIAILPIAVMQSTNTQVDMIVTVLLLFSVYLSLLLKKAYSIRNSILLGFAIGLGFLTKATFAFYVTIPIGILFFSFKKKFKKSLVLIIPIILITIFLQFRFLSQNLFLYGNLLGVKISDKAEGVYINEVISPVGLLSNLVRNLFVHLPFPIFSSYVQSSIIYLHDLIGLDINDPRTTCCGTQFSVKSILYPQEDIVANPIHLIVIVVGGVFLISKRQYLKTSSQIVVLYLLTIVSFVIFSTLIKWQPFHPRLESSFFIVGTMSAIIILSQAKQLRFLYAALILSGLLTFMIIFLNISRSFISYSLFYDAIRSFKPPLASIPEAFYLKPREQQHFNARYYWHDPYINIINLLNKENNKEVAFNLEDGFEYPLWVLMNKQQNIKRVIPYSQIGEDTLIISTTQKPFYKNYYKTTCFKTEIEYGYACISKKMVTY